MVCGAVRKCYGQTPESRTFMADNAGKTLQSCPLKTKSPLPSSASRLCVGVLGGRSLSLAGSSSGCERITAGKQSEGKLAGASKKRRGKSRLSRATAPPLLDFVMPRRRRLDRAGRCRTCVAWCVDGVPSRCACAALSRRARRLLSLSRGTRRRPRSGCR